jgi:O-antigen ligase
MAGNELFSNHFVKQTNDNSAMPALIALAAIFALAKDVAYLGAASDIARLASIGLAGLAGAISASAVLFSSRAQQLLPIIGYLCCLMIPVTYALDSQYVLYHVVSLLCVILGAIAAFSGDEKRRLVVLRTIALYTSVAISLVILIGFAGLWLWPERVWEYPAGDVARFRGVMPKAGGLSLIAVVLIGLVWFRFRSNVVRILLIGAAVVALVMAGSRTPVIAALVAAAAVGLRYQVLTRKFVTFAAGSALVLVSAMWSGALSIQKSELDSLTRAGSIGTLSGRFDLWTQGLAASESSPLFGHGLTMGSVALAKVGTIHDVAVDGLGGGYGFDSRDASKVTLHNGYLQSLLDSGIIGLALYVAIILVSIWRVYARDVNRRYGVVMYLLIVFATANLAENVIQSVSTIYGLLFWVFAVAALSLPRTGTAPRRQAHTLSGERTARLVRPVGAVLNRPRAP